jgi:hypothetical protein
MFTARSCMAVTAVFFAFSLLAACGEAQDSASPEESTDGASGAGNHPGETIGGEAHPNEANGGETHYGEANGTETDSDEAQAASSSAADNADPAATGKDAEEIDPETLEPAGEVELKQYSVAWGGSGTMGGGTLTVDGRSYPFSIVGLGFGGFGASVVEAKGVVYNLPGPGAFPGTYGNARLGMTAGESGGGKLWLRNSDGVVMELESEMRGLALAGGIDGLVVQWEEEEKSSVDDAMDGTEKAVGKGIEAGADAVEKGIGKVKGWMSSDDD